MSATTTVVDGNTIHIDTLIPDLKEIEAKIASLKASLPSKFLTRRVMATAPTVTYTPAGTHTMGSYTHMPAADLTVVSSTYNYRKCSKVTASNGNVSGWSVSGGLAPGAMTTTHQTGVAFSYDAATIELQFQNNNQKLWIKVDGEYISLTPTTLTGDQAGGIIYIDFGSAKMREIEVILVGVGQQLRFTGTFIEPTASIAPVAPRGPKVIVIGDSFGEGTGTAVPLESYFAVLGDLTGWDNVISSSIGGTGLLATAGGTKMTYRQRLAGDVVPYSPDLIIIQGSINDGTRTTTEVSTELQLLIADIKAALPYCMIIVTSMMPALGGGFAPPTFYLAAEGMKLGAEAAGVSFINLLEQELPHGAAITGTITRTATTNATRIYTNIKASKNTTLKFPDGQKFRVTLGTASGTGDYICDGDRTYSGLAIGAAFTVVGNSAWSGNGKVGTPGTGTGVGNCDRVVSSDGVHPSDAGPVMIGTGIAYGLTKALTEV